MFGPVVWSFIYITMRYPDHEYKEVSPGMAKLIYEVSAPYFTKKRRNNNQRKYQEQEAYKDQQGINGEQYLNKPGYISHNQVAKVSEYEFQKAGFGLI